VARLVDDHRAGLFRDVFRAMGSARSLTSGVLVYWCKRKPPIFRPAALSYQNLSNQLRRDDGGRR